MVAVITEAQRDEVTSHVLEVTDLGYKARSKAVLYHGLFHNSSHTPI